MGNYGVKISTLTPDEDPSNASNLPALLLQFRRGPVKLNVGTLSGGHVIHLAVAVCVFNDLRKEAERRGIRLESVAVSADGGFSDGGTRSTGISYEIELVGDGSDEELRQLAAHVEQVAEVPSILRQGMTVRLADAKVHSLSKPSV
jgi:hypothetical protein